MYKCNTTINLNKYYISFMYKCDTTINLNKYYISFMYQSVVISELRSVTETAKL